MSTRAKKIVTIVAVAVFVVACTLGMYFATVLKTNKIAVPAVGITVATTDQVNTLGYLLRSQNIPFNVVDPNTLGIRPEDQEKAEKAIAGTDGIVYRINETEVEQPEPNGGSPSKAPSPSASPTPSPSGKPSPGASPSESENPLTAPSNTASSEPTGAPTVFATPKPTPTIDTTTDVPLSDVMDYPMVPVPGIADGKPVPEDVAQVYEQDLTKINWSENSNIIGAGQSMEVVKILNPAALAKLNEWKDLTYMSGRPNDVVFFSPGSDPYVMVSPYKIPQTVMNSMISYVGSENVSVTLSAPVFQFTVAAPMSSAAANDLLGKLPLKMLASEVPGGKVIFKYLGPMPTVDQLASLGAAFKSATGSAQTILPM